MSDYSDHVFWLDLFISNQPKKYENKNNLGIFRTISNRFHPIVPDTALVKARYSKRHLCIRTFPGETNSAVDSEIRAGGRAEFED
jgi:hypothetical protein